MIKFSNWTIKAVGPVLCRQHDNKTHTVEVIGDIPEGWTWKLLLEHKSMSNIILMEQDESGLHVVLKQEDVPLAGTYKVQLQGTNGELKKHTNQIFTEVRPSIPEQGEAEWPELPSALEQYEQRVKDIITNMGPDWNQNDPEQPSFIKNRTHYTEIITFPIYRDYSVEELTETGGEMPDFPPFYGGDTVEVIVDGINYNCVAQDITDAEGELPPEMAGSSFIIISDIPYDSAAAPKWIIIHEDVRQSTHGIIATKPITLYVPGVGEVEIDPSQDQLEIPPGYFPIFKAGDTVTITVDGVEHSLVALDLATVFPDPNRPSGFTGALISDGDLSGWDPTSGVAPPCTWVFFFREFRGRSIYLFEPWPPVPVSFPTGEYGQREEVKKLPSKYLDLPDWNQNDENGPGYIKNRPFYKLIAENVVIVNYENGVPVSGQGSAKICDLPGDLIPGRTYIIESSEGVEELECTLLTDAERVPWYAEIGYPIIFRSGSSRGIAQRYGYVANGEEAALVSETWWSKDGPLKITGPLDFSRKLNSDLINAPVSSVNNKTGDVYLYGKDIIDNANALSPGSGHYVRVYLAYDNIDYGRIYDRPIVCTVKEEYMIDDDTSIVSLGDGVCLLYGYDDEVGRVYFGRYGGLGYTNVELSGLDEPTLQSSAATKHYVDTEIVKILPPIDGVPDGYVLGILDGKIAWIPKDSA